MKLTIALLVTTLLAGPTFAQSRAESCTSAMAMDAQSWPSIGDCYCAMDQMESTLSPELNETMIKTMSVDKQTGNEMIFETMQEMEPGTFPKEMGAYFEALKTECGIEMEF